MDPGDQSAQTISDEALARESGEGRQEAFAALYERYFHRLYDYARRLVRDDDETVDVVQVSFLKAYQALARSGEPPTSFRSWLYAIAHHEAIDRLRHRRFTPSDDDEEKLALLPDSSIEGEPEPAAERREQARWVWRAMEGLRAEEQEILLLNVREGMDAGEIAQTLGARRETVRVMLSRARDAFEDSFTTLLLLSRGQRDCPELAALAGVAEVSPRLRRDVRRHAAACEVCQRNRQRYSTAAEILGGLAPVPVAMEVKGALWNHIAAQIGSDAGAGSSLIMGDAHRAFWRRWEERWRRRAIRAAITALLLLLIGFVGISATGGITIFQAPTSSDVERAAEPIPPAPGAAVAALPGRSAATSAEAFGEAPISIQQGPASPDEPTPEEPESPGAPLGESMPIVAAAPSPTPTISASAPPASPTPSGRPVQPDAQSTAAPAAPTTPTRESAADPVPAPAPTASAREAEGEPPPDPVPPSPTTIALTSTPGLDFPSFEGESTVTPTALSQTVLGTPTLQTATFTSTPMAAEPTTGLAPTQASVPTTVPAVIPTATSVHVPAPASLTPPPTPTSTSVLKADQPPTATPTRGGTPPR